MKPLYQLLQGSLALQKSKDRKKGVKNKAKVGLSN